MSKRLPTLRQLCFLVSLEKHEHFSKAAKECFVSQPTFSLAIQSLEELLGISLAERSNRKVTLTLAGQQAVIRARKILSAADELMKIASEKCDPLTSILKVGVIPTIAPFVVPKALRKILRKYPHLDLRVKEAITNVLYQDLMEGQLDIILVALPYEFKDVTIMHLFRDPFMFAYHPKSRLFKSNRYSENVLPDASILLLEDGHCLRNHAISACHIKHRNKISPYATSSMETLVHMVENDLGVTFIPKLAVNGSWFGSNNIQLLGMPKTAYREIGFVWRENAVRESEFRIFAEFFRRFAPR